MVELVRVGKRKGNFFESAEITKNKQRERNYHYYFMDIRNIFQKKIPLIRNFFFVFALVGLLVGGFFFTYFHYTKPEQLTKLLFKVANINVEGLVFDRLVGGDIMIAPPAQAVPELPELIGELPAPELFTAERMLVKDKETGTILYGKKEYEQWPIASITKLMSALVLLEYSPTWSSSTVVIGEDWLDVHMYKGDTYTFEQIWNAALIASSNKAVKTFVHALDIPEEVFVARMNEKAKELGMTDTVFFETSGLDQRNVSTASDIVLLLQAALEEEKIQKTLLTREYRLYSKERKKGHHMWNTNWLLLGWIPNTFPKINGGKTGFIEAAQYNLVIEIEDEKGRVLDVVILGAESNESRFTEARDVAEAVLKQYRWPKDEIVVEDEITD